MGRNSKITSDEVLKSDLTNLQTSIQTFAQHHNLSFSDTINLLKNIEQEKLTALIPSYIYRDKTMGILEGTVKYLKEDLHKSYRDIATMLNRDQGVICVSYHNATKKNQLSYFVREPNHWIPVSLFTNRNHGPLEAVVIFLKDHRNCSFKEIATLLNRDNRVVWASYHRGKQKG